VKRKTFKHPSARGGAATLKEAEALEPPAATVINVRAAKDQLSSLLEQAASGHEVIITSDGTPKAKLIPVRPARKPFRVDWTLLHSVKPKPGAKSADEIVREERDGRP
jgi:prevent-host-death family protein